MPIINHIHYRVTKAEKREGVISGCWCKWRAVNAFSLLSTLPPPPQRLGVNPSLRKSTLPRGKLRSIFVDSLVNQVSQMALAVKNPPVSAGDIRGMGLIMWLGISPGGGHSDSVQYSCLENPMDRGEWWAIVHGVTKSWT